MAARDRSEFVTFSAEVDDVTAAASPTDFAEIVNPAASGKLVTVSFFNITIVFTAAALVRFKSIKYSVADTGGTATNATPVASDSRDAAQAAVAVVKAYTANPTPGSTPSGYGAYTSTKINVPASTSAPGGVSIAGLNQLQPWNPIKPTTLLPGESLVVASDGAAHAGMVFSIGATWSERPYP